MATKRRAKKRPAKKSARRAAPKRPKKASRPKPKPKKAPKRGAKKRPVVRKVKAARPKPRPSGPPPPPPDAVEMSGIYERVMVSESDPDQELREIFNHYDRDKNGVIEKEEFARICEAAGMPMDEEELITGMEIVDADHDGKISWDEFSAWWRSLGR